ncbi:MAG TPA: C25 family cysteine peptidase [Candidatus Polarisedimenticolia bacterium]|nr:C25 family cysteine peptidase [Candidatus Polarisedimenticolia bacterium]
MRLGPVGYFRLQRYVEVIYTPVRIPPESRAAMAAGETADLDFYPDVEVDIAVEGAERSSASLAPLAGAGPALDPGFEDAYRKAFVNYEEGRAFRTGRRSMDLEAAPLSTGAQSLLPAGPAGLSPFAQATTPVYRLGVRTTGLYRLSQPYLVGGSGVAPGLLGADPRTFKLMSRGVEVPIRVTGEADGSFDTGDMIEFFGEALIGEPDVTLFIDFCNPMSNLCGFPNVFQANDVTDENAYFLFAEPGTRSRIADLSGTFNAGLPLATSFSDTVRRERDNTFVPLGYDDPYFEEVVTSNGGNFTADPNQPNCGYVNPGINTAPSARWLGPDPNTGLPFTDPNNAHFCASCSPSLPGLISTPDPATIRVHWRGTSSVAASPDHLIVAQVGTTATHSNAICFDNDTIVTQTFTVPQSALVPNQIYFQLPGLAVDTSKFEGAWLDHIEFDYLRSLALSGHELLAGFPDGSRSYQVDGFATGTAADMVVYDISGNVPGSTVPSPRRVTGGTIGGGSGNFNLRFSLAAEARPRRLAMAGAGGFKVPAVVTEIGDEDLLDAANQADYIVIAHPSVVDLGPASPFTEYLDHRAADSNVTIKVVLIDDIYNQFNHGVAHPQALRSFLSYAFDNWTGPSGTGAPPSYVLLVGDGSYDPKNNLNRPESGDLVPAMVLYQESFVIAYFTSDNAVAAFRGDDQLPDVHLGRIPVRTLAEANAVFTKMLDYDVSPPSGAWRTHGLFIADQGASCGETTGFEQAQNDVVVERFGAPMSSQTLYLDDPNYGVATCGTPASSTNRDKFRNDILAGLNNGAALTSYVGHGSFSIWGLAGWLNTSHVPSLAVNDKPTFLVNENCLAGGFHNAAASSLGEAFLKPDGKGAIAVFAPAGLSFTFTGEAINDQLYADLFGIAKERRFGHLITNVRAAISNTIIDMMSFVLMGDPAQRLIIPAPRPPQGFAATGGNAQVTLSWSPGPDPAQTLIYRSENPAFGHSLITPPGGVAGTQFVDSTVINGRNYFYRASSVQAGPFEGAPTNLNSDCDVLNPAASGPDCRWARPLNPNPPAAPTGFAVRNPGDGDKLRVVWNLSPEPDIDFYTVHYGTTAGGPYSMSAVFTRLEDEGIIGGLTLGTEYFMVITATNLSGLTSAPSAEDSGVPQVFEGANPPAMVSDLQLRRSPMFSDAIEVSWSPPSTDIYGGPTMIASYRVHRGTTPIFQPSAANLVAALEGASSTVFHDRNTWDTPGDYYYLVVAVDSQGFASGAGRELPMGISQLDVTMNGSSLMLAWPPATQDVTGALTTIDHYEVYVDTSPLERGRIDMLAPVLVTTSTSASIPDPGPSLRFVSVIVVDVRGNKSPF